MKKKYFFNIAVLLICFCYLFFLKKIPDEVNIRQGETLELQAKIPITFEKKEEEEKETTLVSLILESGKNFPKADKENYTLSCKLLGVLPIKDVHVQEVPQRTLIPGGIPVGIYIKTNGILVIGTSPVTDINRGSIEPAKYLLKSGDYIKTVNGEEVMTKEELMQKINNCEGAKINFGINRNGESIEVAVEPVMTGENMYKVGIWVRDDLAGVGTMTYTDKNGNYGALGHGVSDTDTSTLIDMKNGLLYETNIIGIIKGEKGTPGELTGVINYSKQYCMGSVTKNSNTGVYGEIDVLPEELMQVKEMEVGYKQEVELGSAVIVSTIEGERKEYEIEITGVDYHPKESNKGIRFKVVDEELIEKTGGIVQGMSGSPILQNGKIVGAVTHVFVQDAQKGYGIFIEDMI